MHASLAVCTVLFICCCLHPDSDKMVDVQTVNVVNGAKLGCRLLRRSESPGTVSSWNL